MYEEEQVRRYFSAYSWYVSDIDKNSEKERTEIRAYGSVFDIGKDEQGNNKIVNQEKSLLRVYDFKPHCYILFPVLVSTRKAKWSKTECMAACSRIVNTAIEKNGQGKGYITNVKTTFCNISTYTSLLVQRTAVKIQFNSMSSMHMFCNVAKNYKLRYQTNDVSYSIEVKENNMDTITKFLACRNLNYNCIFSADLIKMNEDNKISRMPLEYITKAISIEKEDSLNVNFFLPIKYFGYDIETFSERGNFCKPNNIRDCIFIISIWIWEVNTNNKHIKKYSLVYGNCDEVKGCTGGQIPTDDPDNQVITFDNELDLLKTYFKLLVDEMPNVITGYNIAGFDSSYIIGRWELLNRGNPIPNHSFIKDKYVNERPLCQHIDKFDWKSNAYGYMFMKYIKVEGMVTLDSFVYVKRENNKLKFYDLSTVSQAYGGPPKHDIEVYEIWNCFQMFVNISSLSFIKAFLEKGISLCKLKTIDEKFKKNMNLWYKNNIQDILQNKFTKNARNFIIENIHNSKSTDKPSSVESINVKNTSNKSIDNLLEHNNLDKEDISINIKKSSNLSVDYTDTIEELSLEEIYAISNWFEYVEVSIKEMMKIINYANRDMMCTKYLADVLDFVNSSLEISAIVNISIEEGWTRGQQIRGERLVYYDCIKRNIIFDKGNKRSDKYRGGYVADPECGISRNIIMVDVNSMYPSIIDEYNIDQSTYVEVEKIVNDDGSETYSNRFQIPTEQLYIIDTSLTQDEIELEAKKKKRKEKSKDSDDEFSDDEFIDLLRNNEEDKEDEDEEDEENKLSNLYGFLKPLDKFKDVSYRRVLGDYDKGIEIKEIDYSSFLDNDNLMRRGILSSIVRRLVAERNRVRAIQKKYNKKDVLWKPLENKQLGCKVVANSVYGSLGAANGKLPFFEGADAVTGIGRKIIKSVNKYIIDDCKGIVIYNDTDSCGYTKQGITKENCWEKANEDIVKINRFLPGGIRMEVEKIFDAIFIAPKNYLYVTISRDGKWIADRSTLVARGVCIARRATSTYLKNFYTEIVLMFFNRCQYRDIFLACINRCREVISNNLLLDDIYGVCSYSGNYKSKTHQNNVFTSRLLSQGEQIEIGDKIAYVVAFIPDDKDDEEMSKRKDIQTSKLSVRMRTLKEMRVNELSYDIKYYVESYAKPIEMLIKSALNNADKDFLEEMNKMSYKIEGSALKAVSLMKPLTMVSKMIKHNRYDVDKINNEIDKMLSQIQVPIAKELR